MHMLPASTSAPPATCALRDRAPRRASTTAPAAVSAFAVFDNAPAGPRWYTSPASPSRRSIVSVTASSATAPATASRRAVAGRDEEACGRARRRSAAASEEPRQLVPRLVPHRHRRVRDEDARVRRERWAEEGRDDLREQLDGLQDPEELERRRGVRRAAG